MVNEKYKLLKIRIHKKIMILVKNLKDNGINILLLIKE